MTTSARVVPTALAASPNAPLPLEAAVPLLTDQQGRLLVNVATSVFPSPVPPPTPVPVVSNLLAFSTGAVSVFGSGPTYKLLRLVINIYAGAGGGFLWLNGNPTPGLPPLLFPAVPLPATVPAYVDLSFDDVNGLITPTGLSVAVSSSPVVYTPDLLAQGQLIVFSQQL